jgi:glycosyltransferase involved in cell wall biosynthesis
MRVIVLMSTFNGERFIDEQVRSILDQLPSGGLLMVRDDGSSDGTVSRIQAFNDSRIQLLHGENIGFAHSFLTLLNSAPSETDMVMFSDQDDVWLAGKIQSAWQCLSTVEHQAALYCSRQLITDQKLNILEISEEIRLPPSFANAIAENIVTGCTAAINREAIKLMQRAGVPQHVRFHDWWLYLVISAHGVVIFDENAHILYRQHENNYLGRGVGWFGRHKTYLKFLWKNDWMSSLIGQLLDLKLYYWTSLTNEKLNILEKYINFDKSRHEIRFAFVFSARRWCRSLTRDMLLRVLLLIYIII